ncbi:transposase [Bifidobacterium longum subsp. longum]|uniref:Transposase n=1 Tax=Bifidobacterium longum subsp. longum TaxID=1679 RepID=A0A4R0W0X9_BIFLL|nr:helix-turn-helix domain-containing protein [Bifidobacterium longum]TCF80426.1 transposase [Bifidobacterium longum subsp. longum]
MGEVYSHLSEEERRVIRIEIGNGTIICGIVLMLGRNASTVGREIKRDTWFPSNENESYRPYRPKRLKTGPWTGGCYIAGPACFASMFVRQVRQCFSAVWADGFPRCRHRFPVM